MAGDGQCPKGRERCLRGDIDMADTGRFGQVGHIQDLRMKYHNRTPYKEYKE
jgi:hypothetical protein